MHQTDEVARGEWIRPRLREWSTILGVIPDGFEAYARVFHPSGEYREGDSRRTLSWRAVTERTGARAHPLMQWESIVSSADRSTGRFDKPSIGALPLSSLSLVAGVLARHTRTRCVAALWDGYGWIDGGEQLELPGRNYYLFECESTELVDLEWAARANWDRYSSPNLLWPDDHAWALATEIDFDSTLIGGTRALVDDLLAASGLEVMEIAPDASLQWDADTINGAPATPG